MKSNDLIEKQVRDVSRIAGFLAWDKLCHLGKSIHHHKD
jgi:hypothetical protein